MCSVTFLVTNATNHEKWTRVQNPVCLSTFTNKYFSPCVKELSITCVAKSLTISHNLFAEARITDVSSDCKMFWRWDTKESSYWEIWLWSCPSGIPGVRDNFGMAMVLSNAMMLHLSSIFVLAFSYFSRSCGRWASSSQEEPHPRTRARSLPVPRGNTATWHCFCNTHVEVGVFDCN